jgi:hypothetical protein
MLRTIAQRSRISHSFFDAYAIDKRACEPTARIAHAYAFQAIMLAPDGTLQLSEPSPFTAGWQHGRIP